MTYASGRVYHDADSHVMEPSDWLDRHIDPSLRDRFPPMRPTAGISFAEKAVAKARQRIGDATAQAEAAKDIIAGPKGWVAFGAFDPAETGVVSCAVDHRVDGRESAAELRVREVAEKVHRAALVGRQDRMSSPLLLDDAFASQEAGRPGDQHLHFVVPPLTLRMRVMANQYLSG